MADDVFFANQGGCSCCGFSHGGMGMVDFMALCSDVETDDGKTEKKSPWPAFMQDEVWADRVKFRRMLKDSMHVYRERYETYGRKFVKWWLQLDPQERKRCFMMPKEEVRVQFNTTYDFKTAYQVVLCSVAEQVENFAATGYKPDGGTDCEAFFEQNLIAKRGAWTVKDEYVDTEQGLDMFLGMFLQLGGDHLLPKRPVEKRKEAHQTKHVLEESSLDEDEDDQKEENEEDDRKDCSGAQSFQSDRRLVRLVVFRYFVDMAWAKFKRAVIELKEDAKAEESVKATEVPSSTT